MNSPSRSDRKKSRLADPHRVGVVAATRRLRDRLDGVAGVVEEQDARGRAAPVALPLVEGLRERHVGGRLPVGRDLRLARVRDGQPRREPALDRHGEELRVAPRVDLAPRGEEDGLAVGREAERDVVAGVVRQPLRHAARGRHHVDVGVALVAAREGDERPVGREPRARLDAGVRGEAANARAVGPGDPQVVRVGERDEPPAGGGIGDEPRVGEIDRADPGGGQQGESGQGREGRAHLRSSRGGHIGSDMLRLRQLPLVGRHHRLKRVSQARVRCNRTASHARQVPGVGRRRMPSSCSAAGKGSNAVRMRLTRAPSRSSTSTPSISTRRPVGAYPSGSSDRTCEPLMPHDCTTGPVSGNAYRGEDLIGEIGKGADHGLRERLDRGSPTGRRTWHSGVIPLDVIGEAVCEGVQIASIPRRKQSPYDLFCTGATQRDTPSSRLSTRRPSNTGDSLRSSEVDRVSSASLFGGSLF